MDKPFPPSQRNDPSSSPETQAAPSASPQPVPFGNVPAFGAYSGKTTNLPADLSTEAWEKSKNTPWSMTPQGRLAIRGFSRGVMGAAFFAAGGLLAEKWMRGYDSGKGFLEQQNPLQFLGKAIDTVVGKPIQWTVGKIAGEEAGLRAVRFRPTKFVEQIGGQRVDGRSLGAETIGITFDFFSASVGDAIGRDIVSWFDPAVKKSWIDDKGNISVTEAAKSAAKSTFRYVTYNGGEDWAVAIPYAYFMKGQRALIDRFSPGFKYDFDRGLNGGSFKLDNNHKVIGAYGLEGLLDLQSRFTVYNIGTLMYREAYNHIASRMEGKQSALYGSPDAPDKDKKGLLEKAGDLGKWMLRSAVKGVVYMTPAVPFFWITRSAQSKDRGVFINQQQGILEHDAHGRMNSLRAYELRRDDPNFTAEGAQVFYGNYRDGKWVPPVPENTFPNPFGENFKPYAQGGNLIDQGFDAIGGLNQKVAEGSAAVADRIDRKFGGNSGYQAVKSALGISFAHQFANRFVNASISYTPYMYAKAECANLWDDGKMDLATERMIDGATRFNWGEFKAGLGEVWNAVLKKPLSDPAREVEAQHRIELDHSAPADFAHTQAQRRRLVQNQPPVAQPSQPYQLSWRERIVAGKANEQKETAAARPVDSRPRSHAESEAMKKALEELSPPTNAIH